MPILSNISLNIYCYYICLLSLEINKTEELFGMMSITTRDLNSNANSISNLFVTLKNKIFSILFFLISYSNMSCCSTLTYPVEKRNSFNSFLNNCTYFFFLYILSFAYDDDLREKYRPEGA